MDEDKDDFDGNYDDDNNYDDDDFDDDHDHQRSIMQRRGWPSYAVAELQNIRAASNQLLPLNDHLTIIVIIIIS